MLQEKFPAVSQGRMPEGYLEAPLAYDAIWAVALGNYKIFIYVIMYIYQRSSYYMKVRLISDTDFQAISRLQKDFS